MTCRQKFSGGFAFENGSIQLAMTLPANKCSDSNQSAPIRSDASLLRGVRAGDEVAAESLFQRYSSRLLALARRQLAKELGGRVDAEDVTQSVFRTLFRRIRIGQYEVPDGDTIWKLLATVALNKVRSTGAYHRTAKRDIRRTTQADALQTNQVRAANDEAAFLLRMTMDDLMQEFTTSQKQIVEMRLAGHEIAEIASATGRSKRTVERVMQGFRQMLRDEICD